MFKFAAEACIKDEEVNSQEYFIHDETMTTKAPLLEDCFYNIGLLARV
jgi:hypothetical protein